ncbi:2-oxoacid:acceptor oxidoreductase subunit alpha, partial [Staphylococcus sp. SIMBA_130]
PLDYNKINIRRGKLNDQKIAEREDKSYYKRFEITDDGVSNRVIPGTKNGIFHVTGVEHDETGKPSEVPQNRKDQMEKRLRKIQNISFQNPIYTVAPHEAPDLLLIGFNSTRGSIEEVIPRLEADGLKVNHAQIRLVHPFPADELKPLLQAAKKVIVVEHNATGQLASLVKMNAGY